MRLIAIGFSFIVFMLSCSKRKVPKTVLHIDKMQAVYWDYIRADVFANEFVRKDSSKNVLIESARLQQMVFDRHKVSKDEFYKSYNFYLKNPPLLKEMLDTMLVRQPKLYEQQNQKKRVKDSIPIAAAL